MRSITWLRVFAVALCAIIACAEAEWLIAETWDVEQACLDNKPVANLQRYYAWRSGLCFAVQSLTDPDAPYEIRTCKPSGYAFRACFDSTCTNCSIEEDKPFSRCASETTSRGTLYGSFRCGDFLPGGVGLTTIEYADATCKEAGARDFVRISGCEVFPGVLIKDTYSKKLECGEKTITYNTCKGSTCDQNCTTLTPDNNACATDMGPAGVKFVCGSATAAATSLTVSFPNILAMTMLVALYMM